MDLYSVHHILFTIIAKSFQLRGDFYISILMAEQSGGSFNSCCNRPNICYNLHCIRLGDGFLEYQLEKVSCQQRCINGIKTSMHDISKLENKRGEGSRIENSPASVRYWCKSPNLYPCCNRQLWHGLWILLFRASSIVFWDDCYKWPQSL